MAGDGIADDNAGSTAQIAAGSTGRCSCCRRSDRCSSCRRRRESRCSSCCRRESRCSSCCRSVRCRSCCRSNRRSRCRGGGGRGFSAQPRVSQHVGHREAGCWVDKQHVGQQVDQPVRQRWNASSPNPVPQRPLNQSWVVGLLRRVAAAAWCQPTRGSYRHRAHPTKRSVGRGPAIDTG